MTLDEIKGLIAAMGRSDLAELEIARDGWTLRLRRDRPGAGAAPEPVPTVAPSPEPPAASRPRPASRKNAAPSPDLRAPLAGIVYLSSSPDAAAFVTVGQAVEAGAILCTIEAMKAFNEVRAERPGTIEAVLVATGDEVEAGQPLFRLG